MFLFCSSKQAPSNWSFATRPASWKKWRHGLTDKEWHVAGRMDHDCRAPFKLRYKNMYRQMLDAANAPWIGHFTTSWRLHIYLYKVNCCAWQACVTSLSRYIIPLQKSDFSFFQP